MATKKLKSTLAFKQAVNNLVEELLEEIHEIGAEKISGVKEITEEFAEKNEIKNYTAEQHFYSEVMRKLRTRL